jgi:Breast carcinoma amplified sequence 2 (BCAS2)
MKALELFVPLVYQIEGFGLIDSLPYLDEYSQADEAAAKALIEQELQSLPKKDYLGVYSQEFKDYAQDSSFEPLSLEIKAPESDEEYSECVLNNKIIIEHLETQKLNLEILDELSQESWTKHLQVLEAYEKKIDHDTKTLEKNNLDINKYRKISQEQSKNEIHHLELQWKTLIGKNALIKKKLIEKQTILNSLKQPTTQEVNNPRPN